MNIARAVIVLLVMVLLLLLLLLLLLADLTVRDRRNGSESMRRVHGCKAAAWLRGISGQSRRMSSAERNDQICGEAQSGSESPRAFLVSRSSADHSL
jgi:hypothetical protein